MPLVSSWRDSSRNISGPPPWLEISLVKLDPGHPWILNHPEACTIAAKENDAKYLAHCRARHSATRATQIRLSGPYTLTQLSWTGRPCLGGGPCSINGRVLPHARPVNATFRPLCEGGCTLHSAHCSDSVLCGYDNFTRGYTLPTAAPAYF